MQHPRSNQLDYGVDDDATVIDAVPHWSIPRVSLARMPQPQLQPPLPRPPLRRPAATLPAPVRAPIFYSYAEEAARQHLDTERVAPLPMSDLESPWIVRLAAAWQRFAAPACGLIAGLILVVGYLASSNQGGSNAAATAPAPEIVMPVALAVTAPDPVERALPDAPPPSELASTTAAEPTTEPTAEPIAAPPSSVPAKRVAPKKRVISTASRSKRRPIRFDTSTPLGSLRPSRSF